MSVTGEQKNRSLNRRVAVQAVYSLDFGNEELRETVKSLASEKDISNSGFALKLAMGVYETLADLDGTLKASSKKWRFSRLGCIERAILRVAVYELEHFNTPRAVVINEAVDMAKEFGEAETAPLINAILDSIRPSETKRIEEKAKASKVVGKR